MVFSIKGEERILNPHHNHYIIVVKEKYSFNYKIPTWMNFEFPKKNLPTHESLRIYPSEFVFTNLSLYTNLSTQFYTI